MTIFQKSLSEILLWLQLLSFLMGLLNWKKIKKTKWIYFCFYLGFVFITESFSRWGMSSHSEFRQYYYNFFVIPVEFIFFFWLYGIFSLKKKQLFWLVIVAYLLSFIPHLLFFNKQLYVIYSFNYTIGTILFLILVILEFKKQIRDESILQFRYNMMFYVNMGTMLFYIGTLPFFAFYGLILKDVSIWNGYYIFFMLANNIMYLLFTLSFIWGKPSTY